MDEVITNLINGPSDPESGNLVLYVMYPKCII